MWLWVKIILDSKVTNHLQMHWYPNDLTHTYQSDALPSHEFVYFHPSNNGVQMCTVSIVLIVAHVTLLI
jgi:hypothetical protein